MSSAQPNPKSCCVPNRGGKDRAETVDRKQFATDGTKPDLDTVIVPAGVPVLGTRYPRIPNDGEERRRAPALRQFRMTATTITNAEFAAFVEETGYVTDAEQYGWSFVFWSQVPDSIGETQAVVGTEWWRKVEGADWRRVAGPGTEARWQPDHPVVHISWNDATAFAKWIGGRLPTEAEWEHAARGGLGDVPYPWGAHEPDDESYQPCNIWQGRFPEGNLALDGYETTAPARSFKPNGFGLYNMVGNVWEWTAEPFKIPSLKKAVRQRLATMKGFKLLKGGSYLCHRTYCWRYRIAARSGASADTTIAHKGFRVVFDL
ncbi:MAG: formylglycine-generating enzyme family protein [Pseudomonadota bacterium]